MAARRSRATEGRSRNMRLWPYRRGAALLASAILLVVLLLVLIGLRQASALPGDRISAWLLLGAVLISLVPVFLSVLDVVAASAGTVEAPGGVRISFAAVEMAAEVEVGRTTISSNLGLAPGMSVAEGGSAILEALKPALGSDVAVLDLGEGQEWWQTRLLLLSAGATRLHHPRVLVFTAAVSGRTKQFVGWASPGELLRVHLRNGSPQLQLAYRKAQANTARWRLGIPAEDEVQVIMPWAAPGSTTFATQYSPGGKQPELVPEQYLLDELASLEQSGGSDLVPELPVTVARLRELFTAVLHDNAVERNDKEELWRDAILDSTDDYLAVTERGVYLTLVPHQAAINAVLRSLVQG